MTDAKLIALGSGLIAVAIIPTPDDLTVVSPLAQLVGGTALVIAGLIKKDDN